MNGSANETMALKVDVDTFVGTRDGVPALLDLFNRHGLRATFLFSLGPDNTGRAIRRVFRRGFLGKVRRTSVVRHYGLRTLMYGVLLPGPHIGNRLSAVIRRARDEGHEVGIHSYDHVGWQDKVACKGFDWTREQLQRAQRAFVEAVGTQPSTLGAAGWQINPHVIAIEQQMGFTYASDVRGRAPFFPTMGAVSSSCMQIPTTLPTLDELIGTKDITEHNVHHTVTARSDLPSKCGHVYTLHAELEGMNLLPAFEKMLKYWCASGRRFVTLGGLYDSIDTERVPVRRVQWGEVEGRSGLLAVEGGA